jgi:hypothetical protein
MSKTLEERFWAKVDRSDNCWEWNSAKNHLGYGVIKIAGQMKKAHRTAYELTKGPIPGGLFVDHICHNRACVKPAHLRVATPKQNMENRLGAQTNNTESGVRGVYRYGNLWLARTGHKGKVYRNGAYPTIAEAEAAVIELRNRLHTYNDVDRH